MTNIDTTTETQNYAGEDERGHVAAANDHQHRAAVEGTSARSVNRRSKGDGHFNNDRGPARANRSSSMGLVQRAEV
ncbi:LOW QUALITY PROTEIN: hypothetical protein PHMEG_00015361 [Phytophthora megakarya]|uniref:Uncharacterized protein n=1 Tax=Phytophthora megakarya TaxID=4795 RepID=A0A225W1N2_9STRA|nr:LOW QUALITY PROTEIN: hypothetical protein PHMEG_00015361 [Phytophthora megakarya]